MEAAARLNVQPTAPAPRYSSDAYAYSLPGGFAQAPSAHASSSAVPANVVPLHRATPSSDRDRTLLMTDAACDLPADWLAKHRVTVLPIKIHVDGEQFVDSHDEHSTLEFFRKDIAHKGMRAQSEPLSAVETRDFVQSMLRRNVDYVIEVAIASSRSKIYLNSLAAAQNLMLLHGRARRTMNVHAPFKMWVVDSETVFAGQGIVVAEGVRQLQAGMPAQRVVQHLDTLRHHVHTLVVPKDLYYLYARAKAKGDNSVGWLTYNLGKALDIKAVVHAHAGKTEPCMKVRGFDDAIRRVLDIATAKVREGLLTPAVCVSYAGPIDEVRNWIPYIALETVCQRRGVSLHLSTMSLTGGINVGAGAFSVAFASKSLEI